MQQEEKLCSALGGGKSCPQNPYSGPTIHTPFLGSRQPNEETKHLGRSCFGSSWNSQN